MVTQEQRRRQLAREKFLRQQQRRTSARRKARMRNAAIASVLGVILIGSVALYTTGVVLGDDDDKTNAGAEVTPSASAPSKAPDPCDKPADGKVKTQTWKKEPAMTVDKSAKYTMKLATTCGDIDLALKADAAPHTVNSFDFLAGKGYFDHTKCHRLTTEGIYVLQCGDPTAQGNGGPGYNIPDENLKDKSLKDNVYPAGTVAMANTGQPDSGGSQFFLVYQDSQLPPSYTPFGTVSKEGMTVLKKIASAGAQPADPTTGNTAPNATVVIDKATVSKS
ncbi:peptidylprolyl isomerase [Streptomyces violaceoruber]|uniref:Peptidyl-prolyl cis-trans isomerase n=4 Tax=Streptomyces TaxID=1883 RepID=Q9KXP0_STRCO|nr:MULTISPECIES: peptidylprolyl isomerase [Streptomyces]MYU41034.1 peptidylprolyl isomerase [Streptomyces sp. SID7813]QSJ12536.1 peptidyl-prolyl cis-trans isomerase [Streptomyces lividans]AIJ16936.1 peptidyl-prolyl cis-trans isomerase [Streptomyces lividans TK24]EFD70405.1 peptidyl-prolyl cis-trans isomerase [Streptomyces lividans TK24]EOY46522.1 putative peptidyl-prolyl cis-trans isomerase B [Streptomyces lividans 1326]